MTIEPNCLSCKAISGEKRISPGPIIYEGVHWLVEHAYPSGLLGWLVIVLRRHCVALHELNPDEFDELGQIQKTVVQLIRQETGCEKEYVMCIAEAERFEHIHFHVVPRSKDASVDHKGTKVFGFLKPEVCKPVPPLVVADFCKRLNTVWPRPS